MNQYRIKPGAAVQLDDFDPDDTSLVPQGKAKGKEKSAATIEKLSELQELLFAEHKQRVLVVLQGMDTSGKDGATKHLLSGGLNPAGVRTVSFKKPTQYELERDYLWRIHREVPGNGEIVIFNRSHYEDVTVVRVHSIIDEKTTRKRFKHINEFEQMLTENGTTILKFFLHISKEEQRERLQARLDDPQKQWKFQRGDIEERKLWDAYQSAYSSVLSETSTKHAPWWVVPANAKWYRDYIIGSVLAEALGGLGMEYPKPDLAGIVIE